ncbi:MAG: NAD(P)H:quinone oxidoreductase, type IV [Tissierellia bacterium]|nr:NAD(P)H:quinone oxidoreductase, type IV [Tissierellia bacterium]
MKLSMIFSSGTGHNLTIAQWVEDEAKKHGVDVRLRKVSELSLPEELNPGQAAYQEASKDIAEATPDDFVWADAVIFSSPARYGVMTAAMKNYLESLVKAWGEGLTINKVVSAFATAQNRNGGQEHTVRSIYTSMMHHGAIIVAPGYTNEVQFAIGGNPYGVSGTATRDGFESDIEEAVRHQTRRTIEIAKKIHG